MTAPAPKKAAAEAPPAAAPPTTPENVEEQPREVATQTYPCNVCGERLQVTGQDEAGADIVPQHDHALPQAETAEAELPRETGTQVNA